MIDYLPKDTEIYSRDGTICGIATGSQHKCSLHGCCGMRITVRWPDGTYTHPCSEGIVVKPGIVPGKPRWTIR